MDESIWAAARASRGWLDEANGTGQTELTCRILKLTEEAGEASAAWIGLLGQNPRKGVTHTREDVAAELADVAFTALVAIESLGLDAQTALDACAAKVRSRLTGQ
ncbi:MazG-like family protein [Micromonospora sp. PSH03]|uniref:MazG-like family protein n=1 Tax=Micromonospora salmantinae TaxID=2911211 RepID=UPI001EE9AA14|nr:MazG-like family protein [Micromonospora salmantinae]MCG5457034.1 MazG-like family protein [Micromonospora salmantinae]